MSDLTSPILVAVCGAVGRMGREVVKTVLNDPGLRLVAAIDAVHGGQDIGEVIGLPESVGVAIETDLKAALVRSGAQVCVDFTRPDSVLNNGLICASQGCSPVIGTTGITAEGIDQLNQALISNKIPGALIPNFAIGAVLMMKFAREASKYLSHAEIIEYHHNQKLDAPSGTSLYTAQLMEQGRQETELSQFASTNIQDHETVTGSRGGRLNSGLHIHSVRLPGLVAHQEVIFGDKGQLLTIRHDSFDRVSFMPGVAFAVKKIHSAQPGLLQGLEHLMT